LIGRRWLSVWKWINTLRVMIPCIASERGDERSTASLRNYENADSRTKKIDRRPKGINEHHTSHKAPFHPIHETPSSETDSIYAIPIAPH
jgi:hypothetical protein